MDEIPSAFWATLGEDLLSKLNSSAQGLTTEEAEARLREYGPNALRKTKTPTSLTILLSQFKSPLTLILIFAAVLSLFVHGRRAAAIVLTIVSASAALGFLQERGATKSVGSGTGSRRRSESGSPSWRSRSRSSRHGSWPGTSPTVRAGL